MNTQRRRWQYENQKRDRPLCFLRLRGVAILGIEYGIEDKIKWAWEDTSTGLGRVNTSKVRTSTRGEIYFIAGGHRVPLAECLKEVEPA